MLEGRPLAVNSGEIFFLRAKVANRCRMIGPMHNTGAGSMTFDVILSGATLLTGDEQRPVIEDGVLAITGNRIAALGTRAEFPVSVTAAKTLPLQGRVITPGFVNVH